MRWYGKIGIIICKIIKTVNILVDMNTDQIERYKRHIQLSEIGINGQEKLLKAKVLVVGAGGLGSPVLQYLSAAGIGCIGIVDNDVVSFSNLQRQVLFRENQIGNNKAVMAKENLNQVNSEIDYRAFPVALSEDNAEDIISSFDVVLGCTDNFKSRLLIDNVTRKQKKAFVHASIGAFNGQVAVFNYDGAISYVDLFGNPTDDDKSLGVVGVLPGIIGSMQANEAIKIILNTGNILKNKLLLYDIFTFEFNIIDL